MNSIGWMVQTITSAKRRRFQPALVSQAREREYEVLAFVKRTGRPCTWMDVVDALGMSQHEAKKRLQKLASSGQLTLDTANCGKGLPARYEARGGRDGRKGGFAS